MYKIQIYTGTSSLLGVYCFDLQTVYYYLVERSLFHCRRRRRRFITDLKCVVIKKKKKTREMIEKRLLMRTGSWPQAAKKTHIIIA